MIQYKIEQSNEKDLTVISVISKDPLVNEDLKVILRTIADSLTEEVHDRETKSPETRPEQTETLSSKS